LYYGKRSMEVDVVHELLHVWTKQCGLNGASTDTTEGLAMEQMTDALATAFVGLHSYFGRGG
jgi:Zn-dependent peptidase ImmA (M78 family)